jgi:hypothetical protein
MLFFLNDVDGSTGLFLSVFFLGLFTHLLFKNVVYAYLLCVLIVISPNGMFSQDVFGFSISIFRFKDIFFFFSFVFPFLPYHKNIVLGRGIRKLIPFLIVFTGYQVFVSIVYKLNITDPLELVKALEYYKFWIFGIYLLIPTYIIIRLEADLFLTTVVNLAIIFAMMVLISVYTPYKFINFSTEERISGSGAMRMMLQNAELFKLIIFIAVGIYFISFSRKYFTILAGLLTFAIPVIGMYRLEMTYTICTMLIVIYFIFRYYNANLFKFTNLIFSLVGILMIFLIVFPSFAEGLYNTFVTTFSELRGDTAQGTTQTRTIIELPNQLLLIQFNPFSGVGFRNEWWMNYDNNMDWGLSDIPITATLAMYGIVGMGIYYSRFFIIIRDVFRTNKFISRNIFLLNPLDDLKLITIFSLGAYFITMISFRFFYISWELSLIRLQAEFGIYIGLFYGLVDNLEEKFDGSFKI